MKHLNFLSKILPCKHDWKAFPLYTEASYNHWDCQLRVKIYSPYVCCRCKKRKNIVLSKKSFDFVWQYEATEYYHKHYDCYTDAAEVEKQIADFKMLNN